MDATELGHKPLFQRLDNETSLPLESFVKKLDISLQYCPPSQHRALKAERAIRTFKNHAIATYCTTSKLFPMDIWDLLLPQILLCLNHLTPFAPNPTVSAYAGIHGGQHDFRAHPIAPAGTRILIHDKPTNRTSWAPHGVPGFYLGPASKHYRCYTVWATPTSAVRITDTLAWFPEHVPMPSVNHHDSVIAAIKDLSNTLASFASTTAPSPPHIEDKVLLELRTLAAMYQSATAATPDNPLEHANSETSAIPRVNMDSLSSLSAALPRVSSPMQPEEPPASCALAALNLTDDGRPLTYALTKKSSYVKEWQQAEDEEITRLLKSNTIRPIHSIDQPVDRKADTTYYNPQPKEKCDAAGNKTYRIRGTIGGDRVNYPGPVTARTADMDVVKILLNSVLADNANWFTVDITDYYLGTPLLRPEYLRIGSKYLSTASIDAHQLHPYLKDGSVLFEVTKGMYGLPQSGLLAQQRLIQHLASHGYLQDNRVPCLFKHDTNGVAFTLVVDDFGIKYTNKEGALHLIKTLEALYPIKIDWSGNKYLGLTIAFNEQRTSVSLSMPSYIAKLLLRFPTPVTRASTPAVYNPPTYGSHTQYATTDDSAILSPSEKSYVQAVVGSLLYYARAVDPSMLPAVTAIASAQAHPTVHVLAQAHRLLAYSATFPDNSIVYHKSDMILRVQSDASYLSRSQSRSVAGGLAYLVDADSPVSHLNGSVHAFTTIIDVVVASAAEAEYAALFYAGQIAAGLRTVLLALGHSQPATLMLSDNACAVGLANDTVKIRRSKSIDMRYHWIKDRVKQLQFTVAWQKGADNLADFFTKPLPTSQHQQLMRKLVQISPHHPMFPTNNRTVRARTWQSLPLTNLICAVLPIFVHDQYVSSQY